jgi:DNA-binding MarR family transcriptional regulator
LANRILEEIKQTKPLESRQQEVALSILRTADALKRGRDARLRRNGITSAQYNVLRILRGAGKPGLPCGGIAELMLTAEPDVTRLLTRMERHGLLVRRRDDGDRRVVTTIATKRGLDLLDELAAPLHELQSVGSRRCRRGWRSWTVAWSRCATANSQLHVAACLRASARAGWQSHARQHEAVQ